MDHGHDHGMDHDMDMGNGTGHHMAMYMYFTKDLNFYVLFEGLFIEKEKKMTKFENQNFNPNQSAKEFPIS